MEVARNDTTWNKAKAIIKDKGVTASFTVLSQFLTSIAKGQLGI